MNRPPTPLPTDPLDRQLEELPEIHASSDFTQRVLRELDTPRRSPVPVLPSRLLWGAVGAGLVAVAVLAVFRDRTPDSVPAIAAEATEIRRQHALLAEELERLRSRTAETAPVLYLGSNDDVDYVLDLYPFLLPQIGGTMPASSGNPSTTF